MLGLVRFILRSWNMHLSQHNVLWRVAVWHMCILMVAHTYVYLKDVVSSLKVFTHQASCNKITCNSEFFRCKLVSKVCTCHVFSKNVSSKNTLQKSEVNIKHYWAGPDVSKKEKQERKKVRDSAFILLLDLFLFSREDNSRENLMVGSRSWCCITTNVLSHIFQDVNGTVWAIVQWADWPGIASRIVLFYHFHIIVYSVLVNVCCIIALVAKYIGQTGKMCLFTYKNVKKLT